MKLPPARVASAAATASQAPGRPSAPARWQKRGMVVPASMLVAVLLIAVIAMTAWFRGDVGLHATGTATQGQTGASAAPDPLATEVFKCSASVALGVSGAPQVAYINTVRADARNGYERVTIEFANGRPRDVVLGLQQSSTFLPEGPAGQPFVLKGQAGALVTIRGADGHTHYDGPADVKTRLPTVLELRQILDVDGTTLWAIGLSGGACFRMTFYDHPVRLLVDFQPAGG